MVAPAQIARAKIDSLLADAGQVLQDRDRMNRTAALGGAVREFQLPAGRCDDLLIADGLAAGANAAKAAGEMLSRVAEQSEKSIAKLPWRLPRKLSPNSLARSGPNA